MQEPSMQTNAGGMGGPAFSSALAGTKLFFKQPFKAAPQNLASSFSKRFFVKPMDWRKRSGKTVLPLLYYISGSIASTGWFFACRNSISASQSVQTVSSAIMSVKLSMP